MTSTEELIVAEADLIIGVWLWGSSGAFSNAAVDRADALHSLRLILLGVEAAADRFGEANAASHINDIRSLLKEWMDAALEESK